MPADYYYEKYAALLDSLLLLLRKDGLIDDAEETDCMYSNQWTLEEYHGRQQFNKILLFPF